MAKKPLVSGSALRFEGQLTVYNFGDGPCYRCLYPTPPPPEMVTNCSDGGVLGAVPGIIGTLQAIEVIKLAAGLEVSFSKQMLIFDALRGSFRNIKLRSRKPECPVCGQTPTLMELIDYEQFCGSSAADKEHHITLLAEDERISCKTYKKMTDEGQQHILVDVREPVELDICKLPQAFNLPISKINNMDCLQHLKTEIKTITESRCVNTLPVIVVCRRGNDSQLAVRSLKISLKEHDVSIKDIHGGLYAWAAEVNPNFPLY